jgi:hypothetical protein
MSESHGHERRSATMPGIRLLLAGAVFFVGGIIWDLVFEDFVLNELLGLAVRRDPVAVTVLKWATIACLWVWLTHRWGVQPFLKK